MNSRLVPALLRDRVFRRYWGASTISMFGDQISGIALPLAIVRASLIAVAVINFFNLMFAALYLLYAVRVLHVRPGVLGLLLGAAAGGGLLGALVTKRVADKVGAGWAYVAGCVLFTAPLVGWPLARGSMAVVLPVLFASEFAAGFGLMLLDISIGAIFAAVIPGTLRSRVTGAFQAVNYGTRPAGALLGGLLGSALGLRSALLVATLGGLAACFLLLPSPLPGYRLPAGKPGPAGSARDPVQDPHRTPERARS